MKFSFYLCAALLATAPLAASAAPKSMGPSAIKAARLKQNPPPNYLAHYLPDDRYKIAGGVWKYVSTDLDTYYHLPSSPNMMSQPAGHVIGFANAKDAEEAGYEPDPTDGTSAKVSSLSSPSDGSMRPLTREEELYIRQIDGVFSGVVDNLEVVINRLEKLGKERPNQESSAMATLNSYRTFAARNLVASRRAAAAFSKLSPPPRFRRAHTYFRASVTQLINSATALDRMLSLQDLGSLSRFSNAFRLFFQYQGKGLDAIKAARR